MACDCLMMVEGRTNGVLYVHCSRLIWSLIWEVFFCPGEVFPVGFYKVNGKMVGGIKFRKS